MEKAGIIAEGKLINQEEWAGKIDKLKKGKLADNYKEKLKEAIINAIKKRIPKQKQKFGVLFSGGVDSSLIALICKKLGADFVCYCTGYGHSSDAEWAGRAAEKYRFKSKIKILDLSEAEKYIKKTAVVLGDIERIVVHTGVGSVVMACAELAKADGVNILFSGLGSEEVFAGYERHALSKDVNNECASGLKQMISGDLKRDYLVGKAAGIKMLAPFLDDKVISIGLKIPAEMKISDEHKKIILREIAEEIGLEKEFAWRRKKAAQYGSNFQKAIGKIARKNGFKMMSEYLKTIAMCGMKIGALVSSGKDSIYAMHLMIKSGFNVECMIAMKSRNPDSYMFHSACVEMVKLQADATGIPVIEQETQGVKEKELDDLRKALEKAKEKFGIKGIVTGALFSSYQKERIEKVAGNLGLKVFSPLWHMNQSDELRRVIKAGFKFMITKIACEGLDKKWLGKVLDFRDIEKLICLARKFGFNPTFEGGEAETLAVDGPIFRKKIKLNEFEIKEESKHNAEILIKKASLEKK